MGQRITVDPITRIEGHLRIDVEVDGGRITNAWSSGTMWRGIEVILQGRDPRDAWAFTQRFCGVCTTVHAIASVRAVENALGMEIPLNAQYVRNLIIAAHAMHDHLVHFYQLSALDWVDVVSALKGDPAGAARIGQSLSDWPGNSVQQLQAVKDKLASFVAGGRLGIFTNGYWGHPAMKLPPDLNLLAVAHYLEALDYQRKVNQIVTLLGSKTPNIQNLAVGGVANPVNLDNSTAINMAKLYFIKDVLDEVGGFIKNVYLRDVAAIGANYPEWLGFGSGVTNYLAVPDLPLDTKGTQFDLPGGTIMEGDLASFRAIDSFEDPYFRDNVTESIARSWYDGDWNRNPWDEETVPKYTDWDPAAKYSFVKAPRFGGKPMQVGPLAAVLVGAAAQHEPTVRYLNEAVGIASKLAGVQLGPKHLHSTLGRHVARAVRCAVMHDAAVRQWQLFIENLAKGDTTNFNPPTFPSGVQKGFGFHEAPRGALSHWVVIENGRIKNYQGVVPSTWNAGPRDENDQRGPYEASLVGNPIAVAERPLEVLRTIHSFDPCLACAVHTIDVEGKEIARVKVL